MKQMIVIHLLLVFNAHAQLKDETYNQTQPVATNIGSDDNITANSGEDLITKYIFEDLVASLKNISCGEGEELNSENNGDNSFDRFERDASTDTESNVEEYDLNNSNEEGDEKQIEQHDLYRPKTNVEEVDGPTNYDQTRSKRDVEKVDKNQQNSNGINQKSTNNPARTISLHRVVRYVDDAKLDLSNPQHKRSNAEHQLNDNEIETDNFPRKNITDPSKKRRRNRLYKNRNVENNSYSAHKYHCGHNSSGNNKPEVSRADRLNHVEQSESNPFRHVTEAGNIEAHHSSHCSHHVVKNSKTDTGRVVSPKLKNIDRQNHQGHEDQIDFKKSSEEKVKVTENQFEKRDSDLST